MNRQIKRLDEAVAARIAAGEVVQNPSSVVKELIENALDAGAGAVTVELVNGGIDSIRVTDNGAGIRPEDMPLTIEKHATSKISDFEDILHIGTLGFRGEALASIAAVSNLTIKSQCRDAAEGCVLKCTPNTPAEIKPAGLPNGTSVFVENLFFNLPARRKFLKKAAAETAKVTDLLLRLALSRPDVSIKCIANASLVLQTPGNGSLKDAITACYGSNVAAKLARVDYNQGDIMISGYVSDPNFLYKSTKNQSIFVNQRYVQQRELHSAVNEGYAQRLMKGTYPFCVLNISIPPEDVDVNIHPAKTTVMLRDGKSVAAALRTAVHDAMQENAVPRIIPDKTGIGAAQTEEQSEEVLLFDDWNILETEHNQDIDTKTLSDHDIAALMYQNGLKEDDPNYDWELKELALDCDPKEDETLVRISEKLDFLEFLDYEIIGTVFHTYVVVEMKEKLYFIDQHAAHERLNYNRLISEQQVSKQTLLIPQIVHVLPEDHLLLLDHREFLDTLGFELDDFGGNAVKISTVPAAVAGIQTDKILEEIIHTLKTGQDVVVMKEQIMKHACRMSVKAGDALSQPEIVLLIEELAETDLIPTCPHGRPIAIVLTKDELEKTFKRKI